MNPDRVFQQCHKYAEKFAEGTNIVIVDPDLVEFFPDSESVNEALRALVSILQKSEKRITKQKLAMQQ